MVDCVAGKLTTIGADGDWLYYNRWTESIRKINTLLLMVAFSNKTSEL